MLNITSRQQNLKTVYNFQRSSENDFRVGVDFEKSPGVRSGGFGLKFQEDRLELRGMGADNNWDILVAPEGSDSSVFVMAPPTGMRNPGATPRFSQVDMGAKINPEDSRKVALQVASAVVGIPFLETLLSLPVPQAV